MSRFILFFAAFCLFAVSCSKTTDPEPLTPEEARRQLAAQSIPYSQGSFIQYARAGDLETVRLFVAAGLDLNKGQGEDKTTALIAAASQGHLAVVRFLVEGGAKNVLTVASNLEYYNRDWSAPGTALMAAAYGAHLDVVRYLVKHLSSDVEMEYALVWAAYRGHMDVVRYLYVEGASVNRRGVTALGVAACCEGHIEIARYLVEVGAIIHANVNTAFLPAQEVYNPEYERRSPWHTAITLAIDYGHAVIVRFLLERWMEDGADAQDIRGRTILMFAAEANDSEMVQRLVENGADINVIADDGFGMTALMRAAERGHLEIVQYLVGQGADPLIVIKGEDTSALSLAEENGHAEVVDFLRGLL